MSEHDFSGTHRRTVRARSFPPEPTFALEDEPWIGDDLCAQTDSEAFFPENGGSSAAAKSVCAACDVRAKCLEYAMEHHEAHGIWGGLTPRDRLRLRRETA